MTIADILVLIGTAAPFLLVLMKQTKIMGIQTEILKNIERHAIENKELHINKENLCKLADDGFRRGLITDVAHNV